MRYCTNTLPGAHVLARDRHMRTPMETASYAQNSRVASYLSNMQNAQELLNRTNEDSGVTISLGGGPLKPLSHFIGAAADDKSYLKVSPSQT